MPVLLSNRERQSRRSESKPLQSMGVSSARVAGVEGIQKTWVRRC